MYGPERAACVRSFDLRLRLTAQVDAEVLARSDETLLRGVVADVPQFVGVRIGDESGERKPAIQRQDEIAGNFADLKGKHGTADERVTLDLSGGLARVALPRDSA